MLVAIGAALLMPVAAAGNAPTTGKGEASSSFGAFEIVLTNVPQVGDISGSVGTVRLDATTLTTPVANVIVEAINSTGHSAGAFSASSSDPDSSQSVSVPFEGPVTSGQVSIAELLAIADADSATAALGALQSSLNIGPLGMSATSPRQGIESIADPFGSSSMTGFSVGPFALSVGDLLPTEVLEALPLSVIFDLAKQLPIDVVEELRSTMRALRDVIESVDALEDVGAQLDAAQAQLDALGVGDPAIADAIDGVQDAEAAVDAATDAVAAAQGQLDAAQAAVDAAEAEVADLTGQQTDLQEQLAACPLPAVCAVLQAQLDSLAPQIAAAQTQLSNAQADEVVAQTTLDDAEAQLEAVEVALAQAIAELEALVGAAGTQIAELVDQLQAELASLLDTLDETLASIPNLEDLISDVVFEIAGSPLFEIGKITVASLAQSDSVDASGDIGCEISGASVLGDPIPGTSCDVVKQAWGDVQELIGGVFEALPVTGLPQISVQGLETYEHASSAPDAQGFRSAAAGLRALRVSIPSVALTDVVDQLVADATAQIEALLGTDIPDIGLADVLEQVRAQLEVLPTGDALGGLRTVGVRASLAEVANQSRFRANNASIAPVPNAPGNPPVANPPAANPPTTPPNAPMPFTGHELTYWAVLASVLLTVGAMVWHAGRRWESVMENSLPARMTRPAASNTVAAAASAAPALSVAVAPRTRTSRSTSSTSKSAKPKSPNAASKAQSRSTGSKAGGHKPLAQPAKPKSQASKSKAQSGKSNSGSSRTAKATGSESARRKTTVRKSTIRRKTTVR
ncbi:MAG TPA: hypothetical protein VHJ82_03505 [Actinomycetota bacterium]|nr:hypothetical protein [Actinomycetota bacterium]